MDKKILITPRSVTSAGWHSSLDILKESGFELVFSTPGKQPTEEELIRLLPGCIGYLAGVEPVTARVLESATNLKVISRNGVGINNVDLEAADRLNMKVCNTPGANARGVAELTIALIFEKARSLSYSDNQMKQGNWVRKSGFELKGKTLGLVGCGMIGREVATLALALGMKVLAFDAMSSVVFTSSPDFRYTSLEELTEISDIISFHCPVPADKQPIFNRQMMEKVKKGVLVINTARGELIDEQVALEGLKNGQIGGMALDVFLQEPPENKELVAHENVTCTAHIGGFTRESIENAMSMAVKNILQNL